MLAASLALGARDAAACAGYSVRQGSQLVPLPKDGKHETVSINADSAADVIVRYADGGSALYINCGDGRYYRAVRSAQPLQVETTKRGGWAELRIGWEGERATMINDELYRPDFLPFASEAPTDLLIGFEGGVYSLPFRRCAALDVKAPLYSFERKLEPNRAEQATMLRLTLDRSEYRIDGRRQDEYSIGTARALQLNNDAVPDAVLHYGERLGSGRESYAALLLGCGDGTYALGGIAGLDASPPTSQAIETRATTVCGRSFPALMTRRSGAIDPAKPGQRPSVQHDLYVYRQALRGFSRIATSPKPFGSEFAVGGDSQCKDLLARLNDLAAMRSP